MGKFALLMYIVHERVSTKSFVVLIIGNSKSNHLGAQGTFTPTRFLTRPRSYLAQPRPPDLAFTRCCNAQYCMVYGVKTGGRKGVECCAIVMQ